MPGHPSIVGAQLHGSRAHNNTRDLLGTGSPVGRIVPSVRSEIFHDEATDTAWLAVGPLDTDWIVLGGRGAQLIFSEGAAKTTNSATLADLNTFTLKAKTLSAKGDRIRFELFGFIGATGTYLMELDIGGEVIVTVGISAAQQYRIQLELVRYTNVTWRLQGRHWHRNGTASSATPSTILAAAGDIFTHRYEGTKDLDVAQLIRFRGRNATTADLFTSEHFAVGLGVA